MITAAAAKLIRKRALAYTMQEMQRPVHVPLPAVPPKRPKEWVLLNSITACINGSISRYERGFEIHARWIMTELKAAGGEVAPVA